MTTNDKAEPTINPAGTADGAVEIEEAQLDQAVGGATQSIPSPNGKKPVPVQIGGVPRPPTR